MQFHIDRTESFRLYLSATFVFSILAIKSTHFSVRYTLTIQKYKMLAFLFSGNTLKIMLLLLKLRVVSCRLDGDSCSI